MLEDAVSLESRRTNYRNGFYACLRYHHGLTHAGFRYERGVRLGDEHVKRDLPIINKDSDAQLLDPIGGFSRYCNPVEYRSPLDSLSIDDFYAAQGYALIFKGYKRLVNQLHIEDMTLTLACIDHPKAMVDTLVRSGAKVTEAHPGIYRIEGKISVNTQLVIIPHLQKGVYEGLGLLVTGASKLELEGYMEQAAGTHDAYLIDNARAVVSACLLANPDLAVALSEEENVDDVVRRTFRRQFSDAEAIAEARGCARGEAKHARATVERTLRANYDVAEIMYLSGVTYDQVADVALAVGIELPRT